MKRGLVLLSSTLLLFGCEKVGTSLGLAPATPTPDPVAIAAAKEKAAKEEEKKAGNWMWKSYKNPLDPNKKKR